MEGQRYDSFVQAFRDANPYLNKQTQFLEAEETWNNLKTEPEKLSQKMSEYKVKAAEFKSLRFWLKTSSAIPEKRSRNDEEAKTKTQGQQTCEDVSEKTRDEGMLSETNKAPSYLSNNFLVTCLF